jgi:glycosyltransferase involved in cell wall biosynthesis
VKVLYLGPYRDPSGYGEAARNYLKVLGAYGCDVRASYMKFDTFTIDLDPEIEEMEKNKEKHFDICIQHSDPGQWGKYVPDGCTFPKNIGYMAWETDRIPQQWVDSCNKMDVILVPCQDNRNALYGSGVTTPVNIVPHTFDTSIYTMEEENIDIRGLGDETKFYSIFQHSYKKGLDLLVPAYYLAFHDCPNEVSLTLRTYTTSKSAAADQGFFQNFVNKFKELIDLQIYPRIILISHLLNDQELRSLHRQGDIYVSASRGEGWCIPAFDAMGFGSTPIVPRWGGPKDWTTRGNSYQVDTQMVPCMGMNHPFLYTPNERWGEPLLSSLIEQMQCAKKFHATTSGANIRESGINHVHNYALQHCNILRSIQSALG